MPQPVIDPATFAELQETAGAEYIGRGRIGAVLLRDRAGRAGRQRVRCRDPGQRLAIAVLETGADIDRQIVPAIAETQRRLVGFVGVLGVVEVESLERFRLLDAGERLVRHLGRELQNAAHRIARIHRRKRTVEHVDPLDLIGIDHAPAR